MTMMHLRKGSHGELLSPIPSHIRDKYNLQPGQEVDVEDEDGVILTDLKIHSPSDQIYKENLNKIIDMFIESANESLQLAPGGNQISYFTGQVVALNSIKECLNAVKGKDVK